MTRQITRMNFDIKRLTKNFALDEVFLSAIATEQKIKNFPNDCEAFGNIYMNAFILGVNVAQPIRDYCGKMIVTSWYSNPELSDIIGRKPSSGHRIGGAVDFMTLDMPIAKVMEWIIKVSGLPFDQCILELRNGVWIIHASHRRIINGIDTNRREGLISPARRSFKPYPLNMQETEFTV